MNQALIVTVAVLAFLALTFFCMRSHAPEIEAEIAALANTELSNAAMTWVKPSADGRNLTIRGTAPTALDRAAAEHLMRDVRGVRDVRNELQLPDEVFSPIPEAQAFETRMMVSSGFVQYEGSVPDTESRTILIAQTRKLFGDRRLEDETSVRDGAPDNWLEAMTVLQQRFATYANAEAVLSGNRINVIGEVAPGRTGEAQLLAASLPVDFVSEISLSVVSSESAEMCQQRLDELMQKRVSFEVASDVINRNSYELLDQLAQRIAACGGLRIEVAGHTDSEGLAMKNLELSQRRAESVAAYLVAKGIDMDQLVPWGYGESRPIEDNSTMTGRAANRRIEFRALD